MSGGRWSERAFRLLMRAWPADVRARFGAGMAYAFRRDLESAVSDPARAMRSE